MSTTMSDTATTTEPTTVPAYELAFPRPLWAETTQYPEDGSHQGTVTVGDVTLTIGQDIPFMSEPGPIYVWLPEVDRVDGAQAVRDLAAALLEAAQVIEAAAS